MYKPRKEPGFDLISLVRGSQATNLEATVQQHKSMDRKPKYMHATTR